MNNEFIDALICEKANEKYKENIDLYGQFVGSWNITWNSYDKDSHLKSSVKGEWIFSYVLNGMAIQDLFIVPSREECKNNNIESGEYGTTIRIYDPKKDMWNVFYGCPGETSLLKAYKIEDRIEQYCVNRTEFSQKWVFSNITKNSFTWQNLVSYDGGKTWLKQNEALALRNI